MPEKFSNKESAGKKELALKWDKITEEVEALRGVDEGKIDKGIKDTVIGLRAHDATITGSCEGHLDHGAPMPWVDIGEDASDELINKIKSPELESLSIDELKAKVPEINQLKDKNLTMVEKVEELLDEFYKDRQSKYKIKLEEPKVMYGNTRLLVEGETEALSKAEKKKALEQGRLEINDFAKFLKDKFFEDK